MRFGGPWHVKGVRPDARDSAREAARRAGMSVGEWLNSVILETAGEDEPPQYPPEHRPRQHSQSDPYAPPSYRAESQQPDNRRAEPYRPQPQRAERARSHPHRAEPYRADADRDEFRGADPYRADPRRSAFRQAEYSAPARDPVIDQVAALNRQLEGLTEGFENFVRSTVSSRAAWDEQDATSQRLADAIARLDQRVEQLAQEGRSASKALERRVEQVDRALSSLAMPRPEWPSPMDQAMAAIMERQRELDGEAPTARRPNASPPRMPEEFSQVSDRLRHLTDQIDALGPGRMQEAIAGLRNDLADVARTLTEASPRRAIEALESEVRVLAARLDLRSRDGGGTAIAKLEQGLAEVRDTLRTLTPAENLAGMVEAIHTVSRRIDQMAAGGTDPAALHQLEGAIAGLRSILAHVASADALAALTDEVRALAARVDSTPQAAVVRDNAMLRNLEERISTIADAIESVRTSGAQAPVVDIDAMVRTLGDKIERLHAAGSDHPALAQLEGRITQLVNKLDVSEARLGNLDAIERGMKELLAYLADMRRDRTPDRPPVDAIARDVRRAEESIEAAHGTIGDVVDRLAMIETGIRGADQREAARPPTHTAAAAYQTMPAMPTVSSPSLQAPHPQVRPDPEPPVNKPAAAPQVHAQPAPARPAPAAAPAAPGRPPNPPRMPGVARPAAVQVRPTADGSLPYDFPLEPGSGKPRPGMAAPASGSIGGAAGVASGMATPAERIAKSKASLESARGVAPEPDSKSNFILAARRAAQFAAETQGPPTAEASAAPFAAAPEAASLLRRAGRLARPVLIGVSIIVLLAAAIHLAVNYFSGSDTSVQLPQESPKPQSALPAAPAARITPPGEIASAPLLGLGGATSPVQGGSGVLTPPAPAASTAMPSPTPVAPVAAPPSPPAAAPPAPKAIEVPPAPPAALSLAPPDVSARAAAPPSAHKLTPPPAGLFASTPIGRPAPLSPAIGGRALIAAAEGGDAGAAYEIALRYIEGRGVTASPEEAALWFERAGRKGLTQALFRLGGLYEKGTGVKKDLQRARTLYAEAADRGNAKAMHNLAVLYAEGIDGKPDYVTAVKWFHKAAARGVADSQFNLGVLYARGIGMEQNLAESYKWFALAAQTGDTDAAQKRDDVGKRLDAQTVAAVRAAIQKWTPEPQPEDATTTNAPNGGWDQGAQAGKSKSKRA